MNPITREEHYLAAIAGDEVEIPSNPLTRIEAYLARIADRIGTVTINDGITATDDGEANVTLEDAGSGAVDDVQINGTSILSDGVANIPLATANDAGVAKAGGYGVYNYNGSLRIELPTDAQLKGGAADTKTITPLNQHKAAFFGLAKAAGDSTQSASSNAVGTYTESAKSAISQMLNAPESVSGSTPSITAKAGVRYICGECSTLAITTPASGIIDVVFESGSTPTVLTVTPPTGLTMKWANGFDPTALEANTVYEINIMNGNLGVVGSWS